MKKKEEVAETAAHLSEQMKNLQILIDQVSLLETRISTMAAKLNKFSTSLEEPKTETRWLSNIIPFPSNFPQKTEELPILAPILAKPGASLPPGMPDFRSVLQKNGLILLGWDKRMTEKGELFCAYWVTSSGIPRFYASNPFRMADYSSAHPDHKSYAAEDGIEFYGQDEPAYIVHVAPELMMGNPKHNELRLVHIKMLKSQGSNIDFDYKYLLKTEKTRSAPVKKPKAWPPHQAGA